MTKDPKVLEFPKHKVVRDIPGEVLEERRKRADQKMADSIVVELTAMIITELDNYYVTVEDETFAKDLVLVVDALRATIYRQMGFEHHLHKFIEKNISIISKDEAKEWESLSQEDLEAKILEMLEAKQKLDSDEEE